MERIEGYISNVQLKLGMRNDAEDFIEQLRDHAYCLFEEFKEDGMSDEQCNDKVIQTLGEPDEVVRMMKAELRRSWGLWRTVVVIAGVSLLVMMLFTHDVGLDLLRTTLGRGYIDTNMPYLNELIVFVGVAAITVTILYTYSKYPIVQSLSVLCTLAFALASEITPRDSMVVALVIVNVVCACTLWFKTRDPRQVLVPGGIGFLAFALYVLAWQFEAPGFQLVSVFTMLGFVMLGPAVIVWGISNGQRIARSFG